MRSLLLLALGLLAAGAAHAQLSVGLDIKRREFLLHEPVIATVSITNMTGRDVMLGDTDSAGPWFSFQIKNGEGRSILPRTANYEVAPLQLHAGESVKRTVNLNELYKLDEYGTHHIKASIYFAPLGKYFASKGEVIELTEGRLLWKQTVGVPDGDENAYRTFSLMTMEQDKGKILYVRVDGANDGACYGCYSLGRVVADFPPDAKFDRANNLWVLQLIGQKTYFLSRIGINGDFQGQSTYVTPKSIPFLRKLADGTLQIVGAVHQDRTTQLAKEDAPKLSDRPAGLPK